MAPILRLFVSFCFCFFLPAQQHADPEGFIRRMESPERVEKLQVERVLETLQISPGQKIADLGAGSGLFSRPMARRVAPGGVVYAVDVDPNLLQHIEKSARQEPLSTLRTVLASEDDPRIPEPVDLIFLCDTLHHMNQRPAYLQGLRRYLRPGGRIAVIDFLEEWPSGHEHMRYTVQELDGWMRQAGFQREAEYDFLENNFFVVYRY